MRTRHGSKWIKIEKTSDTRRCIDEDLVPTDIYGDRDLEEIACEIRS